MLFQFRLRRLAACLLFCAFAASGARGADEKTGAAEDATPVGPPAPKGLSTWFQHDPELDSLLKGIVEDLSEEISRHSSKKVAAALIDLGKTDETVEPRIGSWRGDVRLYPASVVKVIYMAAAFVWNERGDVRLTDSLKKDLEWMIGPSSNTATQRVLNRICGVESGAKLSEKEYKEFAAKRNQVNEWLHTLGFKNINACQATWDGSPSARDMQLMTKSLDGEGEVVNHNKMSAVETAELFWLIATDRIATPEHCEAMRKLMERQAVQRDGRKGYRKIFQDRLPAGTTIWGKSGFTSETSHDAAIITTKDGRRLVLVVFTEVNWDTTSYLGDFAVEAVKRLNKLRKPSPTVAQGKKSDKDS